MIVKLAILLLILFILPPVIGCLWTHRNGNLAAAYLYGLFTMLTVFQLLAVPMSYFHTSLTLLVKCYLAAIAVLALLSVARNRTFAAQRQWLSGLWRKVTPVMAAVLVCMALQAAFVTVEQHVDEDDALYLGTAATTLRYYSLYKRNPYTGKKSRTAGDPRYILASWPTFLAFLARVSSMHPTVLAHMFLPAAVFV